MVCGYVYDPRGRVRPFLKWREIREGKFKGLFEVTLPSGPRPRTIRVHAESIRRFPENTEKEGVRRGDQTQRTTASKL